MKNVYCIMGRTASGKDTLVNTIIERFGDRFGYKKLKSYTTRPRRVGEGDTHIFINKSEVENYTSRIVAYTKFGEYEYFATSDQFEECDFYIIDPIGYYELKQKTFYGELKNVNLVPILCLVASDERKRRSVLRGDDPEVFKAREEAENDRFNNLLDIEPNCYILDTTNLEEAVFEMLKIMDKGER